MAENMISENEKLNTGTNQISKALRQGKLFSLHSLHLAF